MPTEEITASMRTLIDSYTPELIAESRRLAAQSVQFETTESINVFNQRLGSWHSGWAARAGELAARAWGRAIQDEDGVYSLANGQVWRDIDQAEAAYQVASRAANRIEMNQEDYVRAKDRAASLVALYSDPAYFSQEYRRADPDVRVAIQEAYGSLLPINPRWNEMRHEIETDRRDRLGDGIQNAQNARETVYIAIEQCYQTTAEMARIFGAEFGPALEMGAMVDRSLIGEFVPHVVRFAGVDALREWHAGVVRISEYVLSNGNPQMVFRFSKKAWGIKNQGNRYVWVG